MSNKVKVKRNKDTSVHKYDVSFVGLTIGEVASIMNALDVYTESGSVVASDVLAYLKNGIQESSDSYLKDLT